VRADALAPKALFDSAVHYEIPVFQRPYVWSEDDQATSPGTDTGL
jgi:hypothetical protein